MNEFSFIFLPYFVVFLRGENQNKVTGVEQLERKNAKDEQLQNDMLPL